jgi:diaminobutyrate-2-oxoglutarate transaminase
VNDKAFKELESAVRSYCRNFPVVLERASGSYVTAEDGRRYLDLFCGAGTLNYGHNHPRLVEAMSRYLQSGSILHSLDFHTTAKRAFLERFRDVILRPRGLSYVLQFTGPTGTNAVEAAIKLARKLTGRRSVAAFTNAFHGMTVGSLSISATEGGWPFRSGEVTRLPYDGFMDDALAVAERMLTTAGSGVEPPAAIVLEVVQGEGGLNVATFDWLRGIARLAKSLGAVLVIDDIQAGCGRTGPFFSFEGSGVFPDIVCLSKSLSGSGMPMSLVLISPELDAWQPGEHNGTFRGNNLAFVSAHAALSFWETDVLEQQTLLRSGELRAGLDALAAKHRSLSLRTVGRGLMMGLRSPVPNFGSSISREAFHRGVICESCGPRDEVLKIMPALTIEQADLRRALDVLDASIESVRMFAEAPAHQAPPTLVA